MSSMSPSSSSNLASSSLKDLLKICRSHALQLPAELPEDKQFYIDMIVQHRQMKAAAMAAAAALDSAPSASALADTVADAITTVTTTSTVNMSRITERRRVTAPPPPVDADEAEEDLILREGYVEVSATLEGSTRDEREEGEVIAGDAADDAPPGAEANDVPFDEEEDEFARSPVVQKITNVLQNIAVFDYLERHTSVPRFYWFVLFGLLSSAAIFLWVGPLAVCDFICFIYPAYRTFKTLEGKFLGHQFDGVVEDQSIEVHRYWLTYWVVYGLFRLFEFVGDYTLYWLPYYHPMKIVFLVWCFHPSSAGCTIVYSWVIRPFFLPREEQIDRLIHRAHTSLAQACSEVRGIILKKVAKRIAGEDTPVKEGNKKEW